jgi:hypothetical protein
MLIKFLPLDDFVWNNSEDNSVQYILPPGYGEFETMKTCRKQIWKLNGFELKTGSTSLIHLKPIKNHLEPVETIKN